MTDERRRQGSVLVVTPVRNRSRLVVRTLDTLLAQTHAPDELVVVDDGSTDDGATPQAIERWVCDRTPPFPVSVVQRAHGGPAAARNTGLAAGRPMSWVAFLDSDDLWPPDFLARCLAAVEDVPDAVAVSTDQRFVTGPEREVVQQDASGLTTEPANWLIRNEPCLFSCSLLRRDVVDALGGLDEDLQTGEDMKLLLPMTLEGPWVHAPGAPVVYQRDGADGEETNSSRMHADRFRRWAQLYDELLARPELRATVDPALRSDRLWWYWFEAGEELYYAHRREEARPCYARAIRYRPRHLKLWRRWLKCFTSAGRR